MKKKIVSLCLVVALVAVAVAGASLAYFTSTDTETNTFTVGNVKIDLIEQERKYDEEGVLTGLGDFTNGKTLAPIVGSAQGAKDEYGLPTAENYVDKVVTVKNTGVNEAYVRVYFAIPSALDDGSETFNAGLNVLHFNFGNVEGRTTYQNEWIWHNTTDNTWKYFETTINGIMYNVYYANYASTLAAGETTEQFVQGVYLDKSFDIKADGAYAFGKKLTLDEGWNWNNVSCPVYAIACQADGFDTADEAFNAAFGADYNPWGTTNS